MRPKPINVVLCDSFTFATDVLSADPDWNRTSHDRWMHGGEQWRVITQPRLMRGHRVDKTREIGEVHLDLRRMAKERRMIR